MRIIAVFARHVTIRRILICDRFIESRGIGVSEKFPRPWRFACSFRQFMSGILGGFEVCALVNSNGLWLMDLFSLDSVGLGYSLALSALARSPSICAVGQGSCASSVVLGFHGILEYWLKLQVCWWTYLALTLAVSLLGVQRVCIARMRQMDVGWCALKTRVVQVKTLPCEVQVALSCVASSQLMGDHDSEVGKSLQVCIPDTTISCCHLCHSMPDDFSNRVRRHHEQDGFGQHVPGSHQQNFPWWSLLLFVLSMALWSLSIALRVARMVTVLFQALAVRLMLIAFSSR